MLFFINMVAINTVESSTNLYWSVSITNSYRSMPIVITPTNLIIKYPSDKTHFMVFFDRWDYSINKNYYFPKPEENFIITTNRVTTISHGEAAIGYDFTLVSFTNGLIGFRVDHSYSLGYNIYSDSGTNISHTYYVALSDTLVEVGEADVDNPNIAKMEDEED